MQLHVSPSQRGSYLAQHLLAVGHPAKPDPSNRGQSDYHGTTPGFTLNFFVQDPEVRRFATTVRLAWDASSSTIRTLPLSVTPWSGGPGSSRRGGAIGMKSTWDVLFVLAFALAFALRGRRPAAGLFSSPRRRTGSVALPLDVLLRAVSLT